MRTNWSKLDVYVVDNASTDKSVQIIRKQFPKVKLICHSTNLGYAAGYNRALKKIKAHYIVLLNTDTEILNSMWVESMVRAATTNTGIAAVACKMVSMQNPRRLNSVGVMGIPFWRGFVDIGKEELDEEQYDNAKFEPFSFCGGAVLINRSIFEEAGGFDARFFMYVEDVDLSWRLRILGYRIAYAPEAVVAHSFSGMETVGFRKFYLCHRNLLRAILKNCGPSLNNALFCYFLFSLTAGLGFIPLDPGKTVAIGKAIFWNLLNLRDSYSLRLAIQSSRRESDEKQILSIMYPKIRRYQPTEYASFRRILDIIFEHQRSRYAFRKSM